MDRVLVGGRQLLSPDVDMNLVLYYRHGRRAASRHCVHRRQRRLRGL